MKPSMLVAAALPAMTTDPKKFTEDWMMTLEMANSELWIPAGTPSFSESTSSFLCIFSLLRSR